MTKDPTTATPQVALTGRRTFLRPPLPSDYEWIYATACIPEVSLAWRTRGTIPSLDAFVGLLYQQTDAQFLIGRRDTGDRVGLVQLFGYNHRDGVAQLSLFLHPDVQASGWAFEAVLLFVNYCFSAWPLRRLYLESPEPAFQRFQSGAGELFEVEGRLREHEFFLGEFVDRIIGVVERSVWEANAPLIASISAKE